MSVLLAIAIQAATEQTSPPPQATQDSLNAIADACHAPRKWLELRRDEIVFRADPDESYDKIACVLKKVSASLPTTPLGFVGNAQVSEEK
ncbi:MAG TPA: hypothetical protein VNJ10_15060 [Sphingomonas sp.]|nr:hypothetical protein [Sphingomonas sp.]